MSSIAANDVVQTNSLVWFRNDLRVDDHNGLKLAINNSNKVVGFYCFNPKVFSENKLGFKKTDVFRTKFLIETVDNLKENLKKNNISLIIKIGDPVEELSNVITQHNISNIYMQKEWTKEEYDEEALLKSKLTNILFHSTYDQFLYHPDDVDNQFISDVFTNFRK